MPEFLDNVTELIGNTPLLRLTQFSQAHGCVTPILAKLEGMNPGGSVKDRTMLGILRDALRQGRLKQGDTVLEVSAGNQGVSLAMLCAALGLRCVVVLPDDAARARLEALRKYGAETVLIPAAQGAAGCQAAAEQLRRARPGLFLPEAFSNESNPQIHRETTGPEILRQAGSVDYFIAGVGTGGTITGCGEVLRMDNPDCRVIAVEPYASPVLSGGFPGSHPLAGIGPGFVPEILNLYLLDEIIKVKTPDALALARELAEQDGLCCGPSSGAALFGAILAARRPEARGKTVVTILPDSGIFYEAERKGS